MHPCSGDNANVVSDYKTSDYKKTDQYKIMRLLHSDWRHVIDTMNKFSENVIPLFFIKRLHEQCPSVPFSALQCPLTCQRINTAQIRFI